MSLFETGVIPAFNDYILKRSQEKRDYGDYWSASSAGYCMRKQMFERLGVPAVKEDARKYRVFEAGHVFHKFMQDITKEAGLSVAQELELQSDDIMVRGHIDDLILVDNTLILYDYKSVSSRSFSYQKQRATSKDVQSHYHKMQLGTYMYMLRKKPNIVSDERFTTENLTEARILKISKDDLRQVEEQLLWTPQLEKEVVGYWSTLNGYWKERKFPKCTCADFEGGFLAKEAYNPYYYNDTPCSIEWFTKCKKEGLLK